MKRSIFSKVFMAIVMILAVMAVSFSLTSCGEKDYIFPGEKPTPSPDDPAPVDPDWYVYDVFQVGCEATSINWKSSANVTLTKSTLRSYSDEEQEGYAHAQVSHSYTADIEYRDKNGTAEPKHVQETQTYTSDLFVRLYGLSKVMLFRSEEELANAIGALSFSQEVTGSKLYIFSLGGSRMVILKATATKSAESLSFPGKIVTDLCHAEWAELEYIGKEVTKVTSDQSGYDKYNMTVKVRVTVANAGNEDNSRVLSFVISNIYVKQAGEEPDPIVPVEPELVGYDVINENFANGQTSGTIIAIYDDLSQKEVARFNEKLNHYTKTPEELSMNATSLDWTLRQSSTVERASTGSSRYVDVAGVARIIFTEAYTSVTNRTNHAARTFEGRYEIPTIQFFDKAGTSKELPHPEYSMIDKGVEETASSETSKTLTHKVIASYDGASETLTANVILNKVNDTPQPENKETSIAVENFIPRGNVYIIDVNHNMENAAPIKESISIPNSASLHAEDEKSTAIRNYNTPTPSKTEVSIQEYLTTSGTLSVKGEVKTYVSDFVFPGVNVRVTFTYLAKITLTSQAGNSVTIEVNAVAYKKGASLGTQDFGDSSKSIFKDSVNFALFVQNSDIATCTQVLRYEEAKQTPVDPTPEEPTEDIFARVVSNSIDFVNGYWTATMKAAIKNSKGEERDTTMQVVYTSTGVSFGAIADFVSKDNNFDFTRFNNGSATTSDATSGKAVVTYTKQNISAVYNKFNHDITVTNGAAYIMLAGQKLEFLPTQIAVGNPSKDQVASPTTSGSYNVWASSVTYRYGFNNHFDNSTTSFNIKVKKPIIIEIDSDAGEILGGATTITFDANYNPMISLVVACKNKTFIYNDVYSFKSGKTSVDVSKAPLVYPAMTFANIPSATNPGIGPDRVPANLVVINGEGGYYTENGFILYFSKVESLTTGCKNLVIAEGILKNGMLEIQNGDDVIYFKVKS